MSPAWVYWPNDPRKNNGSELTCHPSSDRCFSCLHHESLIDAGSMCFQLKRPSAFITILVTFCILDD
uniref:Ovule protein n=1 Tax=Caenorhabditis tropicalis TaxID=1561998 RepID=A0A1I7U0B3_9PELO